VAAGRAIHFPYVVITQVTRAVPILKSPMRIAALALLAFALASTAAVAATPSAGTLSVEGAVGVVTVTGRGAVLGRVVSGSVRIVDTSPDDRWEPMINGIAGIESYTLKGRNLSFRVLGGEYRIVLRGEGISLAARGRGVATIDGDTAAAASGTAGIWSVTRDVDCRRAADLCDPVADILRKISFGLTAPAAGEKS
jgi:hypothetical protein